MIKNCRVSIDELEHDRATSWRAGEEEAFMFHVEHECHLIWNNQARLRAALDNHCFTDAQIGLLVCMYNMLHNGENSPVAEFVDSFAEEVKEFADGEVFKEWRRWK